MKDIVEEVVVVVLRWMLVDEDDEEKVLKYVRELLDVKNKLCKEINMLYFDGIIDKKLMKLDECLEEMLRIVVEVSMKKNYVKVLEEIEEGRGVLENIMDFIEYLDKSEMK